MAEGVSECGLCVGSAGLGRLSVAINRNMTVRGAWRTLTGLLFLYSMSLKPCLVTFSAGQHSCCFYDALQCNRAPSSDVPIPKAIGSKAKEPVTLITALGLTRALQVFESLWLKNDICVLPRKMWTVPTTCPCHPPHQDLGPVLAFTSIDAGHINGRFQSVVIC